MASRTSCDRTTLDEAEATGVESKDDKDERKIRLQRKSSLCEMTVLIVTIGTVWSLMLLPIIFWHLPVNIQTVST